MVFASGPIAEVDDEMRQYLVWTKKEIGSSQAQAPQMTRDVGSSKVPCSDFLGRLDGHMSIRERGPPLEPSFVPAETPSKCHALYDCLYTPSYTVDSSGKSSATAGGDQSAPRRGFGSILNSPTVDAVACAPGQRSTTTSSNDDGQRGIFGGCCRGSLDAAVRAGKQSRLHQSW